MATDSRQVTITLNTDCLLQLLRKKELHLEDFRCLDAASRQRVRRLLIQAVRNDLRR